MAGHEVPHRRAGDAGQLLGGLVAGSGDHRLDSRTEIRLGAPALPSSGHRAPPGQELSRSPLEAGPVLRVPREPPAAPPAQNGASTDNRYRLRFAQLVTLKSLRRAVARGPAGARGRPGRPLPRPVFYEVELRAPARAGEVAGHGYVTAAQGGRGDGPGVVVGPAELCAPPCQVMGDRAEGRPGGVGPKTPRRHVGPGAFFQVPYHELHLGVGAVVGVQLYRAALHVGNKGVVLVGLEEGELAARGRLYPAHDEAERLPAESVVGRLGYVGTAFCPVRDSRPGVLWDLVDGAPEGLGHLGRDGEMHPSPLAGGHDLAVVKA